MLVDSQRLRLLILRQLTVEMESEYVKSERIPSIDGKVTIVYGAAKNVTMIVQMIQILAPALEGSRSVAAELAAVGSGPVNLMIVLVVVERGLEA